MPFFGEYNSKVAGALAGFLGILSIFFIIKGIEVLKQYQFIGSGTTATNTIQVSGTGDAFAVPDIADINFSISNDAKTMDAAQKLTTDTANKALAYLKSQGIADADIKTTDYSANPKYEWHNAPQLCLNNQPCPPGGQNVQVGFTVSESMDVKVRKTDQAGAIVTGLGSAGVTNISGPNFTVDNEDTVKAQARSKAIDDAKAKADELAKELGVKLVRIVNFSENSGGNPYPIYAMDAKVMSVGAAAPAPAPLQTGQNKYTSDVTITYEIR
jgi:uncharacterized protein YggE